MSNLPSRLKAAREAAKLTQEELAKKIGSGRVSISRWETGQIEPSRHVLASIGYATGHNPDWLLTGDGTAILIEAKPNPGAAENVVPYQAPALPLDQALMESAMLAVLQLLEARNLKLSPERTVAGVMAVYEAARAQGKGSVTDADVTPLVRLLMA